MVMLATALENEIFDKFDRVRFPKIRYAGMLQYDGELKLPNHYLVSPPEIERTSGEYLVHNGIRTFACRYCSICMFSAQVHLLILTAFCFSYIAVHVIFSLKHYVLGITCILLSYPVNY